MSIYSTPRSPFASRRVRSFSVVQEGSRIGVFALTFIMATLIGVMSFGYLVQATRIQARGTELRKLELQRSKLMNERATKGMQIAHEKSLVSVRDGAITLSMSAGNDPVYFAAAGAIAQRP